MRTLLKIIVGLVALLVVAVGGIYVALSRLDLGQFHNLVNARIEAATGHVLHIDGALRVAPSLRPTLVAEGIRFSDAQGTAAAEIARATRIEASVEFLPLLRGEVRIARVLLEGPRLVVTTDERGRSNWDFSTATKPTATPATPPPAAPGSTASFLAAVGEIGIDKGEVEYRPNGGTPVILAIERATLRGGELADPVHLIAELRWQQDSVRLDLTAGTLGQLLAAPRDIALKGRVTGFGGRVDIDGRIVGQGIDANIVAAAGDLGPLKKRLGKDFGGASGPVNVSVHAKGTAQDIALTNLVLKVGTSDLAGSARYEGGTKRPKITADVRTARFDLADFGIVPPPATATPSVATRTPPAIERDRLIPDTPIDFKLLQIVDADVRAEAATLRVPLFEFKDAAATVTLRDGKLDATVTRAGLAGGEFTVALNVDSTKERPSVSGKVAGHDFPIGFFLRGNIGNQIEGLVSIDAELSSTGVTPAKLAGNLDGHVQLLLGAGRANIRGLETWIGGIGTALGTLFNGGDDWSVVNCSALRFVVRDGIATGEVILFDSRFATVGGEGTIDLGHEKLDLLITPKSKAAVTLNIAAPVRIQGTFLHPTFALDSVSVARRILGIAGIFVFPPAAVAGLVSLGASGNTCVDLAVAGRQSERPIGDAPATPATTPAVPAAPQGLGRALENLDQGIRNLFGC